MLESISRSVTFSFLRFSFADELSFVVSIDHIVYICPMGIG